jgi:hypothetical protein
MNRHLNNIVLSSSFHVKLTFIRRLLGCLRHYVTGEGSGGGEN